MLFNFFTPILNVNKGFLLLFFLYSLHFTTFLIENFVERKRKKLIHSYIYFSIQRTKVRLGYCKVKTNKKNK